jgi:hypothetical protein
MVDGVKHAQFANIDFIDFVQGLRVSSGHNPKSGSIASALPIEERIGAPPHAGGFRGDAV